MLFSVDMQALPRIPIPKYLIRGYVFRVIPERTLYFLLRVVSSSFRNLVATDAVSWFIRPSSVVTTCDVAHTVSLIVLPFYSCEVCGVLIASSSVTR